MSEETELEAIADGTTILGKSRSDDVARIRQLETDLRALRAAALDILLLWENENSGELPAFWKAIARLTSLSPLSAETTSPKSLPSRPLS